MEQIIDNAKTQNQETQAAITPAMAIEMLKAGNTRFVENKQLTRNLNEQVAQTGGGQSPFAAVLGCIDSRVPAELVFDQESVTFLMYGLPGILSIKTSSVAWSLPVR